MRVCKRRFKRSIGAGRSQCLFFCINLTPSNYKDNDSDYTGKAIVLAYSRCLPQMTFKSLVGAEPFKILPCSLLTMHGYAVELPPSINDRRLVIYKRSAILVRGFHSDRSAPSHEFRSCIIRSNKEHSYRPTFSP